MEILSIKRPNNGNPTTGLKIYATVVGDSGTEYKIGYFRRASFRGWMCSCPNFVLSQFGKGGHCKHINLIQEQYGRYGALVGPSKQRKFEVGQLVFVPKKTNEYWTGLGIVEGFIGDAAELGSPHVSLRMISGLAIGKTGAFPVIAVKRAKGITLVENGTNAPLTGSPIVE